MNLSPPLWRPVSLQKPLHFPHFTKAWLIIIFNTHDVYYVPDTVLCAPHIFTHLIITTTIGGKFDSYLSILQIRKLSHTGIYLYKRISQKQTLALFNSKTILASHLFFRLFSICYLTWFDKSIPIHWCGRSGANEGESLLSMVLQAKDWST